MAHQTSEIDTIIRQTEALNWNGNTSELQPVDPGRISSSNPTLVGKIISLKNILKATLKATLQHVWNFIPSFAIEDIEPNTYLFIVSSFLDQEEVLHQVSWKFKRKSFVPQTVGSRSYIQGVFRLSMAGAY
jgi:hypothetical protein